MTEPLLPGAPPRQCSCCHRPVPTGRVYGQPGLGEKCARRRGVIPPRRPRVAVPTVAQEGPDLFDLIEEGDDDEDDRDGRWWWRHALIVNRYRREYLRQARTRQVGRWCR